MRSPAWRQFRVLWWATYDSKNKVRRCYVCGISQADYGRTFDLHHITYERLGKERFTDLVPICSSRGGRGMRKWPAGNGCHEVITRRWRARKRTGLTMTLAQLTDAVRAERRRKRAS